MNANYNAAFEFTMGFEGYKSEGDPDDPGGRTIFGISERAHPEIVKELWDLPKPVAYAKARGFYLTEYWNKAGCPSFHAPKDIIMFDTAVNLGIARAQEFDRLTDNDIDFLFARMEYYIKHSKEKYLRGLFRRVVTLYLVTK